MTKSPSGCVVTFTPGTDTRFCRFLSQVRQASTCALAGQEWRPVKSSNFPALYTNRQGNRTQDPLEIKSRTITNQSSEHFYLYLGVSRVNATWNISVQTLQNVSHCGGKKKPVGATECLFRGCQSDRRRDILSEEFGHMQHRPPRTEVVIQL